MGGPHWTLEVRGHRFPPKINIVISTSNYWSLLSKGVVKSIKVISVTNDGLTNVTLAKRTHPADTHRPSWRPFTSVLWHPTWVHLTARTCQSPVTTWSGLSVNKAPFLKYTSVVIWTYNRVLLLDGCRDLVKKRLVVTADWIEKE